MTNVHGSLHSLRKSLKLSSEEMTRLLDVSAETVERWDLQDASPSRTARARLAQLEEIAALGRIIFTAAGLAHFLTTPMPLFDGHTALELIESDQGERVLGALAADYEGLGH